MPHSGNQYVHWRAVLIASTQPIRLQRRTYFIKAGNSCSRDTSRYPAQKTSTQILFIVSLRFTHGVCNSFTILESVRGGLIDEAEME